MPYRLLTGTLATSTALVLMTLFLTALTMAPAGCSAGGPASMNGPDPRAEGAMTFYRLDGDRYPGDPVPPGATLLHGYSVLKSCAIEDRATREEILGAFERGIADHEGGVPSDCFRPRHAIRVVLDGSTTDYLICFQCSNWMSWKDGIPDGGGNTSDSPRDAFDRILDGCAASS
ncbi:MAG: hypothetical protein P8J59_02860 [Phycisphaerales bacterium]|jgi:hypothetical protein|nr:hypothetical protein [Phycisphaerales bacterium]